jgi:hypothetical protein
MLRLEEVEPQLLVGLDPQVPLADGRKNGSLRDGIRGEMVELHPKIVGDGLHESARRHPESPLVEGDKVDHVALRQRRFLVVGWRHPPLRQISVGPRTKETIAHELL